MGDAVAVVFPDRGGRHVDVVRSLSERHREKEKEELQWQQQKREDLRLKKREKECRERLHQRANTTVSSRGSSQPPPPPPAPACTITVRPPGASLRRSGTGSSGDATDAAETAPESARVVRAGRAATFAAGTSDDHASPDDRRQYQARCNSDIERRQDEAIRKVQERANLQRVKHEREQLKRQWRAYKAQSVVLSGCQNETLKGYLEGKAKPRALPKLPVLPGCSPGPKTAAAEDSPTAAEQDGVCGSVDSDATTGTPSSGATSASSTAAGPGALSGLAASQKVEPSEHASSPSKGPKDSKDSREQRSINRFLTQQTIRIGKNCSDLAEWKKRNGIPADKRVFCCVGGYPDFREALLARGWVQNTDKSSPFFDLKWGMARDIDHERILPNQVANHFDKTRELTTKVGLTLNLRNSYYWGVDLDSFYPRAFDLYDQNDRSDFVMNFKFTKAEAILHNFIEHVDAQAATTFNDDVVSTCVKICMRTVTDPGEVLDSPEMAEALRILSAEEWSLLEQVSLDDVNARLEDSPGAKDLDAMIQKKSVPSEAQKKSEAEAKKLRDAEKDKEAKKTKKKKKAGAAEAEDPPPPLCAPMESFQAPRGQHLIKQARSVLQEMGERDKQHALNGGKNAWIIKPSGKSRGRGIRVVRELNEIFRMTESDGFQWICQKYMEQPHLVHGFKFDIRQWVLVTDWNPLTVYIWRHPYLRFAGQKYDGLASKDPYVHLTNNSIIKYMDGFDRKDDDLSASGFMWFKQQYESYIHATCCRRKKHKTPWLIPPPYTCESYGVKWEDVAFTAEEDDEEVYDETRGSSGGPPPSQNPKDSTADAGAAEASDNASEAEADEGAAELERPGSRTPEQATEEPATDKSKEEDSGVSPSGASAASGADERAPPTGGPSGPASAAQHTWVASGDVDDEDDEACCENLWDTEITPQMEKIIIWSLLNVCDSIAHRKNTCELYGYDFMISSGKEKPEVWLIEVNSSPACDYSTPVTCPLVKKMMEDTAKVMVDLKDNPSADTGEWELIKHQHSKPVSMRTCACSNLEVCGKRVKAPKGFKKKCKKMRAKAAETQGNGGSDDEDLDS